MNIFELSVTGGVLILAVLLVRAVGKKWLPMRTFTVLWHVALLRLFLPVELPSPISAASIGQKLIRSLTETFSRADNTGTADVPFSPAFSGVPGGTFFYESSFTDAYPVSGAPSAEEFVSSARFAPDWRLIVWIAGAALLFALFTVFYIQSVKRFRQSLPLESDFARNWLAEHVPRRRIEVRTSDRIDSPLTYGVLRPVILLPSDTDLSDTKRLEFILAHELTHIRHFDSLTKILLAGAVSLHWFNPAVWVLYRFCNRDMELACDEAVVRMFGADTRRDYALMLLELVEKKNLPVMPSNANGLGQVAIRERIGAIMKVRRITWTASLAAVIAVCGITAVFATTSAQEKPAAEEQTETDALSPEREELRENLEAELDKHRDEKLRLEAEPSDSPAAALVCWPLSPDAFVTVPAEWGWRLLWGQEDFHRGIDLGCESGTEVLAFRDGTVTISEYHASYGNYVVIDHGDGLCTLYAHLSDRLVSEGDPVAAGQRIGHVGMTGSAYSYHLHFETLENGEPVNPRDYLDLTGGFETTREEKLRLEAERTLAEEKNLRYREKMEEKAQLQAALEEQLRREAEQQAQAAAAEAAEAGIPAWEKLGISEEEYLHGEKYQKLRERLEQKEAEQAARAERERYNAEFLENMAAKKAASDKWLEEGRVFDRIREILLTGTESREDRLAKLDALILEFRADFRYDEGIGSAGLWTSDVAEGEPEWAPDADIGYEALREYYDAFVPYGVTFERRRGTETGDPYWNGVPVKSWEDILFSADGSSVRRYYIAENNITDAVSVRVVYDGETVVGVEVNPNR